MIGKPEWFERRKYGGWGFYPRTWQGWVYLAFVLIPFVVFQALPYWDARTRMIVTTGWAVFLLLDAVHIMVCLKKDERERKIEALAERNAAWVMMLILAAGLLYEIISSSLRQEFKVNWFLVAALFGGMIVKTISNIMLERRALR
ncbi:hypothetical protein KY366_08850 [Candidatus Woesearchaeota archaeon]|nr:hypothetical protein [Candidatus Woesearchaeota archaeon]